MPHIQAKILFVQQRVSEVKFQAAHHKTLRADAEQFGFERVDHAFGTVLRAENFVERVFQVAAQFRLVDAVILAAVADPDVVHALLPQFGADAVGNGAALLGVPYPEIADFGVRRRERIPLRHARMVVDGGVEIQPDPLLFRPCDPVFEIFVAQFVALHAPAVRFRVDAVQVELVFAGDQFERLGNVAAQFVGIAGAAGIIARSHDARVDALVAVFKPDAVVALPAVDADVLILHLFERRVGIHPESGIDLSGGLVALIFLHDFLLFC